jgi:hypothetical protein
VEEVSPGGTLDIYIESTPEATLAECDDRVIEGVPARCVRCVKILLAIRVMNPKQKKIGNCILSLSASYLT